MRPQNCRKFGNVYDISGQQEVFDTEMYMLFQIVSSVILTSIYIRRGKLKHCMSEINRKFQKCKWAGELEILDMDIICRAGSIRKKTDTIRIAIRTKQYAIRIDDTIQR